MDTRGFKVIEEVPYGVYVWRMPDGRWIGDDDGNFLSIAAMKGDLDKVKKLTEAARYYGVEEGAPYFLSGHRKIDDEEYEKQKLRMSWGLVPDEYDAPAIAEDLKHGRI